MNPPNKHNSIRIKVKEVPWTVLLLPLAQYEAAHGDDSNAICIMDSREIHLVEGRASRFNIAHELGHAYISSCLVDVAQVKKTDMEELFCDIIGHHAADIVKTTNKVFRHFNKET